MLFWILPTTIIVFLIIRLIAKKIKTPLFNSLVISVIILIAIMLLAGVSYNDYAHQVRWINDLLPYSVVALAYPLYEIYPKIKSQMSSLLLVSFIGSLFSMISGVSIVLLLGGNETLAASILPKSVTTAIAVTVSQNQHGIPSITAVSVVIAGVFGSVFGYQLSNWLKIKREESRGLAIGTVSHALGTAKALEININDGAYSTLALVVCGIITSVIAPFIFPLLLFVLH